MEFVACGQMLQDEGEEELSPVQIRHHIFLILKIKKTFPIMHVQKGPLEIKQGVMSPTHRPLH